MSIKKLVGSYPVIGIRPVIDGRQGPLKSRESLEEQTMNMALSAKKLLEDNLKYSDGSPAKVIISDTTIARVPEAAASEEKFRQENVAITLTVTPCWCYGSETMDMDNDTIKGVWGFNGTERPGAVYLAAVLAAHAQKGLPAFGIYGHEVQDADDTIIPEDVKEKILRFGRAAIAAKSLKGKSYLQIGAMSMGIVGSAMDYALLEDYFGMRVESVDEVEILRRIEEEIYNKDEYDRALNWVKKNCKEGIDPNPDFVKRDKKQKEKDWEFTVKTAVIVKDLMRGNDHFASEFSEEALGFNAIAAGFQGQRQWTDHWPNADFTEAVLNSSFDWDGAGEPLVVATENDILNGIGMLFNKLLTNKSQLFADVRTYFSRNSVHRITGYELEGKAKDAEGILLLLNSGAGSLDYTLESLDEANHKTVKPFYDMTENDILSCLDATKWCVAHNVNFRGGGFSTQFLTRAEVPLTMIRLNLVKGLGPVLQLVEGWSVHLPDDVNDKLMERSDSTWPTTWFVPRIHSKSSSFKSSYDVMNNWGSNHGAISHGHIGEDIITLCSMLRIPVCMHNISEDKIFRPAAWNSFGMDKENADYRACDVYGALYKKV